MKDKIHLTVDLKKINFFFAHAVRLRRLVPIEPIVDILMYCLTNRERKAIQCKQTSLFCSSFHSLICIHISLQLRKLWPHLSFSFLSRKQAVFFSFSDRITRIVVYLQQNKEEKKKKKVRLYTYT